VATRSPGRIDVRYSEIRFAGNFIAVVLNEDSTEAKIDCLLQGVARIPPAMRPAGLSADTEARAETIQGKA
jgi:hypothetical protein